MKNTKGFKPGLFLQKATTRKYIFYISFNVFIRVYVMFRDARREIFEYVISILLHPFSVTYYLLFTKLFNIKKNVFTESSSTALVEDKDLAGWVLPGEHQLEPCWIFTKDKCCICSLDNRAVVPV